MLNANQKRRVLGTVRHIDRELAELERLLAAGRSKSPLSGVMHDLSPTQCKVIQDSFARIRAALLEAIERHQVPLDIHRTSLSWSIQTRLQSLQIAVAELGPRHLRGYGGLDHESAAAVDQTCADLERLLDRLTAYLRQGLGQDLQQRLARLEAAPFSIRTLSRLETIITKYGLVEFRPLLDTIVRRLESPRFEIAVFGRVSSGKSSLLNHILGRDVLPVGVTPVTAVPIWVMRGEQPVVVVSFADGRHARVGVEELTAYASEEGNPGNAKHVTGVEVRVPAARLLEGVVFVDTPGIGSLATSGAAETFAYLPRCDLGVVLLDAGSTLDQEDLAILRSLYDAGVLAMVLISKCDLLTPRDRGRVVSYVRRHLERDLGLDLPVSLVSTVGTDEALLDRWFDEEIVPLLERHQALAAASLRRKVAHLHESVMAVLQTLIAKARPGQPARDPEIIAALERTLSAADLAIARVQAFCQDRTSSSASTDRVDKVIEEAARRLGGDGPLGEGEGNEVLSHTLAVHARDLHEAVQALGSQLADTLEILHQMLPLGTSIAPRLDFKPTGLPAPEIPQVWAAAERHRPWLLSFVRPLAVRAARRRLQHGVRDALVQVIHAYDRHLQAWARDSINHWVELYESHAEIVREQVRRLGTTLGTSTEKSADLRALEADLEQLASEDSDERSAPGEVIPVPSDARSPSEPEAENRRRLGV